MSDYVGVNAREYAEISGMTKEAIEQISAVAKHCRLTHGITQVPMEEDVERVRSLLNEICEQRGCGIYDIVLTASIFGGLYVELLMEKPCERSDA